MKQKQEQGLLLRHRSTREHGGRMGKAIFRLMGGAGMILTFGGLCGYKHMELLLAMTAVLWTVWTLMEQRTLGSWFPVGAMATLLILSLLTRQQILEGFRIFWNDMSDTVLTQTGWLLPQWQRKTLAGEELPCNLVFSLAVCLAALPAGGTLGEKHPGMLGMGLLLTEFLGAILLNSGAQNLWLLAAMAVAVFLSLPDPRRKKGILETGAVCALLTGILLLGFARADWLPQLGQSTQKKAHGLVYDTASTTLPEGDLAHYAGEKTAPAPALTVTMEVPQTLYLRGFTGEILEDGIWKQLPGETLTENRELLSWLEENLFSGNTQFAAAGAEAGLTASQVVVRNTGACGKWQYVPFHLCAGETGRVYDLKQGGIFSGGHREYTYQVLGTAEDIQTVLTQLQRSGESDYRKGESAYREFVYANYMQIPEDMKETLEEHWQRIAWETPDAGQNCAVRFLGECFPEEGESLIELPLENAAGASYQYATIAVVTLRYFGIPARYAEGYVIREETAQESAGSAITVDSSAARAWVEVYQDGIGWIPMELTPGLSETSYPGDPESQNMPAPEEEEPEEEPEQEPEEEQPDTLTGTVTNFLKRNLWLWLPLLMLVLLAAGLVLRRFILLKRRMKRFQTEDPGASLSWVVADSIWMLGKSGFHRENGSLRKLEPQLREQLGEEYVHTFQEMVCLNEQALFSSRKLEETHRQEALRFRDRTILELRTRETWLRRWWRTWIRCVY